MYGIQTGGQSSLPVISSVKIKATIFEVGIEAERYSSTPTIDIGRLIHEAIESVETPKQNLFCGVSRFLTTGGAKSECTISSVLQEEGR
tara:strand:+ start:123 stop:389 length:267 start_codon:yes stop_codon:yes gene_type:complete